MIRNTLRCLLLACMALVAISVSKPAHAYSIIATGDFTFSESGGVYTIGNNSADWYIWGLAVGIPSLDTATTTQPNWYAYVETIPNIVNGPTYGNVYLANNYQNLTNDVGPGQSSSLFFFTELASTPTIDIVNSSGSTYAITGNAFSPIPAPPIVTPLPAALPLFATGLGALGLLGWRRKRKALAA
jgi:hypothetical protein